MVQWWTEDQASQYLAANQPFAGREEARKEIQRMLEEGTLPARYRRPDGTVIKIKRYEWKRKEPPPGFTTGYGVGELEWRHLDREYEQEELQSHEDGFPRFGIIEVQSEPLRRMCAPPMTPDTRGRPAKIFLIKLAAYGAAWLAANGLPSTHRELVDVLNKECDARNWAYGDTQIREMASELITEYRAALNRSS